MYQHYFRQWFSVFHPHIHYHLFSYNWSPNKWLTLFRYSLVQCRLIFFLLFKTKRKSDILFGNTILSAGGAIAGKIRRIPVVVHVHEERVQPASLNRLLFSIQKSCATQAIFVSHYLSEKLSSGFRQSCVIPNCPAEEFEITRARPTPLPGIGNFTVAMGSTLKTYKGVKDFASLAKLLPDVQFIFYTQAMPNECRLFFSDTTLPPNFEIQPNSSNMVDAYSAAHLVVSLTQPEVIVESFGLSLLEAMCCSRAVIGPNVGGPAEIIEEGKSGFMIPVSDLDRMRDTIDLLRHHPERLQEMSENARIRAGHYSRKTFADNILKVMKTVSGLPV